MTAALTPNREAVKSAMWWLYEGAIFGVLLADTSAAATPPALDGSLLDWLAPTDYTLADEYDVFLTAGTVDYDTTDADRAELQPLSIVLDYASTVTYTDLIIVCVPSKDAGASPPSYANPIVAVIHEPNPVTLLSTETKTYNLDLFAEWI